MTGADWIAVDWGTTHLRVWVMDAAGQVVAQTASTDGMGTLDASGFEPALLALISPYLETGTVTPVICCGMVGARQGWAEAAYAAVPCRPPGARDALRVAARDPRLDVRILPGLSQDKPADVMRGEETQAAGFLANNPDFDGVLCLPGTHSKWVHVSAGEVVSFQTYMTGELFALLSERSVLRHGLLADGWDDGIFRGALEEAISRPQSLAAALFSLRANGLLHGMKSAQARARLSGLLIGLELAGARPYWLGRDVALIGDGSLAAHYATALSAQGVPVRQTNVQEMTLSGLRAAYLTLKEDTP